MSTNDLSKKQTKLQKSFNSTKPNEELLKTFRQMKTCFQENELANECFTLVQSLQRVNRDQDATIFIKKANKILLFSNENDKCPNCSLADNFDFLNANILNMKGSVSLDLKNYKESFNYLNVANRILTSKFDKVDDGRCAGNCVLRAKEINQYKLHKLTVFTKKFKESASYAVRCLKVREKLLEEDFMGQDLAKLKVSVDALVLKLQDVQIKHLGSDTVEVAKMRLIGEREKGLGLRELSDNVGHSLKTSHAVYVFYGEMGRYARALEKKISKFHISDDGNPT